MPTSPSRLAYSDCFDLMDLASEDPRGKRTQVRNKGEGYQLRVRLHTARNIDRKDNLGTYAEDHPMHGRSSYDNLTITVRHDSQGQWWVYLERNDARVYNTESLAGPTPRVVPTPDEEPEPEPVPFTMAATVEPKTPIMEAVQGLIRRKL